MLRACLARWKNHLFSRENRSRGPNFNRRSQQLQLEALESRKLLSTIVTESIGGTQYLTIVEPDGGSDGMGAIVRINPTNGTTQLVSDNTICGNEVYHHPTALTLETINGTGYLTMIDPSGGPDGMGSIVRINPTNGGSQLVSDNAIGGNDVFDHPTDLITEITGGGTQYLTFLDPTGGPDGMGSIVRINEFTGGTQLVSDNAICGNQVYRHPTALTLETINGTGYLTMIDPTGGPDGMGSIVRINPYNGGSQLVSDNTISGNAVYDHPTEIITEITGSGTQYLTFLDPTSGPDGMGSIVRINEFNGGSQLVSDNAISGNGIYNHPTGLTLETINGVGYLTLNDPTGGTDANGVVVRINPNNGGSQVISNYAINVAEFQWGNNGTAYTLGTDHVLFVNGAPVKTQITDFAQTRTGAILALDTKGELWYSPPGKPNTWEQSTTPNFAVLAVSSDGMVYIRGDNGTLWESATGIPNSWQECTLGNLSVSSWTVGKPGYSGTIAISGGAGFNNDLVPQGLPPGLSATLLGNIIRIIGTPPTTAGTESFTVSVSVDPNISWATLTKTYNLTLNSGPATSFVTGISTNQVTVGQRLGVTIRAVDQFGNTATSYNGTITLASSDPTALSSGSVVLRNGTGSTTLSANHSDQWLGINGATLKASGMSHTYYLGTITISPSLYLYTFKFFADDSDRNLMYDSEGSPLENEFSFYANPQQVGNDINNRAAVWGQTLDDDGYDWANIQHVLLNQTAAN